MLELVRYIHLNHLRASIVKSMEELDRYPWCGHAFLIGRKKNGWQETEYVLGQFIGERSGLVAQVIRRICDKAGVREEELRNGVRLRSR